MVCVTLSRKDHICAQTRELACTKLVLPQVLARGMCVLLCYSEKYNDYSITIMMSGLKVVEVAHDNSSSVKNYTVQDLNLINSYDT